MVAGIPELTGNTVGRVGQEPRPLRQQCWVNEVIPHRRHCLSRRRGLSSLRRCGSARPARGVPATTPSPRARARSSPADLPSPTALGRRAGDEGAMPAPGLHLDAHGDLAPKRDPYTVQDNPTPRNCPLMKESGGGGHACTEVQPPPWTSARRLEHLHGHTLKLEGWSPTPGTVPSAFSRKEHMT